MSLPLIDGSPLLDPGATDADRPSTGRRSTGRAGTTGFLLVTGHGVDPTLRDDLERASRAFFALPEAVRRRSA